MKFKFRLALLGLIFLLASANAFAAKRYWISGSNSTWNVSANWSSTSGGAGSAGVPGANDTAYFDGGMGGTSADGNDTLDINISIKRLEISNTYNGVIIQGTRTVTIGTSGAVLSGGTFSGGSASITVSGAFIISGCTFTSTSGTFSTSASFTFSSGTFIHNNGTVSLTATSTFAISKAGGATFYNLTFAPTVATATFTITSTTAITVSNLVTVGGNKDYDLNGGTFHCTGNITVTNTLTGSGGGTMTLLIDGSGTQTLTGTGTWASGRLPKITITKSLTDTLKLLNAISVTGDWTYNSGIIKYGTSAVIFVGGQTITGSHKLGIVQFYHQSTYTITSGDTLSVAGTLYLGTSGLNPILNTGIIRAEGNIDISTSTSGANGGGTATILIAGTGAQSLLGSTTGGAARICNIKIDNPGYTLTIFDKLTILGNWTHISGTINPTTSTLLFGGNRTITESDTLFNVTLNGSVASTYTIASGTTLTVSGLLRIEGTAAVTINTGTINAKGNINITNTSTTGGGSATIVINGTVDQDFIGSGTANTGPLCNITITKPIGHLFLSSFITCAGDWIYDIGQVHSSYISGGALVTSTVAFTGTKNLDGFNTGFKTLPFYNITIYSGTRTLTGNLEATNNLTIGSSATLPGNGNNISVGGNWLNQGGTWTPGSGTVTFKGSGYNRISKTSATETFGKIAFSRNGGSITLGSPVKIDSSMTLTAGHIKTTSSNYLLLIDNATLTGGNDGAYVHGPVRKIGNDAFVFPLGDTTLTDTSAYHPLGMTAPSSSSDYFEATYFAALHTVGDSLVDSLLSVSQNENWKFERSPGAASVTVKLGWNRNSVSVEDLNTVRIANWNGVKWLDLGATNLTSNGSNGTITATGITAFNSNLAYLTFGTAKASVPYAILKKKLDGGYYQVVNGRLNFRYDEEYNDSDNKLRYNIYDYQNMVVSSNQIVPPTIIPGVSYGDNRIKINTLQCGFTTVGGLTDGVYILEIINEKNEHWYLRFKQTTTVAIDCYITPLPN